MKQVIFLLLIGAVMGYVIKSNDLILGNVHRIFPSVFPANKSVLAGRGVLSSASMSAVPKDLSLMQKELTKLSLSDIASSSPRMQLIIHLLQKLPKEQIKSVCENMCNGIQ